MKVVCWCKKELLATSTNQRCQTCLLFKRRLTTRKLNNYNAVSHATSSEVMSRGFQVLLARGRTCFIISPVSRTRRGCPVRVAARADQHDHDLDKCKSSGNVNVRIENSQYSEDNEQDKTSLQLITKDVLSKLRQLPATEAGVAVIAHAFKPCKG
uniref:Uncharacterized protein n=1 Tax=Timema cristinae TaxID=61476 RepID=A0A7R9H3F9_TIMCR|nr:unnamed protein product [Timema cristinae]